MIGARAWAVHAEAVVWDNHTCLPHRIEASWADRLEGHWKAGVTFVSVNLGDADVTFDFQCAFARHLQKWILENAERFILARTVEDIALAKRTGRLAIAFDVEGARAIEGDLSRIETLYDLGVRWMALVFNRKNLVGGGVHDENDMGLSPFGCRLLDEMDRTGMVVCCSHTGYRTAHQVLERGIANGRPIVFSHSNARALHDHPRNIPDDLIRLCAQTGGVIGINGLSIFLGEGDPVDRFASHLDHVCQLVGVSHAGIGLDFVYDQEDMDAQLVATRGTWPPGYGYEPGIHYLEPAALPRVTDRLLSLGYDDDDIAGVLGANFLRVARSVWR